MTNDYKSDSKVTHAFTFSRQFGFMHFSLKFASLDSITFMSWTALNIALYYCCGIDAG